MLQKKKKAVQRALDSTSGEDTADADRAITPQDALHPGIERSIKGLIKDFQGVDKVQEIISYINL